jgi:hypothetical protein
MKAVKVVKDFCSISYNYAGLPFLKFISVGYGFKALHPRHGIEPGTRAAKGRRAPRNMRRAGLPVPRSIGSALLQIVRLQSDALPTSDSRIVHPPLCTRRIDVESMTAAITGWRQQWLGPKARRDLEPVRHVLKLTTGTTPTSIELLKAWKTYPKLGKPSHPAKK